MRSWQLSVLTRRPSTVRSSTSPSFFSRNCSLDARKPQLITQGDVQSRWEAVTKFDCDSIAEHVAIAKVAGFGDATPVNRWTVIIPDAYFVSLYFVSPRKALK